MTAAGFQGNVGGGALGLARFEFGESGALRMVGAVFMVPAPGEFDVVLDDDASDCGVGGGKSAALFCLSKGKVHPGGVAGLDGHKRVEWNNLGNKNLGRVRFLKIFSW